IRDFHVTGVQTCALPIWAQDGSVLWRFDTLGPVQCEPYYDKQEDALYFGSNDGALYKVDASSGALRWRFSTGAEISRRVVLEDEIGRASCREKGKVWEVE